MGNKKRGKYLFAKHLPRILLIFNLFRLFLDGGLCGGKRELIISTLWQVWETFGKHYEHVLHILHPISSKYPTIFATSTTIRYFSC